MRELEQFLEKLGINPTNRHVNQIFDRCRGYDDDDDEAVAMTNML